ncbi:MAG: D-alanine--D-alanine ligase [Bifidobacteriaceae bacterium]|jgi:D-alanine-D-alanine ligase|nr:D-alanine--D-alanine ligase [Bifidobacteriaceae bacterium]
MSKKVIGLLYGGNSPENPISIKSATNIFNAFETFDTLKNKYSLVPIYIDYDNSWEVNFELLKSTDPKENPDFIFTGNFEIHAPNSNNAIAKIDSAISMVHGSGGEDGSLQKYFSELGIPLSGCDEACSVLGFDKSLSHDRARESGVDVTKSYVYDSATSQEISSDFSKHFDDDKIYFVKPARSGSSFGITKITTLNQLESAVNEALKFDTKIIIEEGLLGSNFVEVECAVLQKKVTGGADDDLHATLPCSIHVKSEFYDFDTKYENEDAVEIKYPALIPDDLREKVRIDSQTLFKTFGCSGLSRFDYFVDVLSGTVYFNEINTLPGFANVSMFPKMLEAEGIGIVEIIESILSFA